MRRSSQSISLSKHSPLDWRPADTLRQNQEIRTYYDFPDVDVDRYMIDGSYRSDARRTRNEFAKASSGSQNWVNERLIYTHGYGVTMNPVSRSHVKCAPVHSFGHPG